MGTLVNYATEKGVAVLTLSDPPVNAYTYEMLKELDECILEARFDNDVHALVIVGRGDRYFSAGSDINILRESDPTYQYYVALHATETLGRLEQTPKLTIAALNGHAVAGGLELALACDLRIGRSGTYLVGLPEVSLGLLPGMGGTQRLARLIGKGMAMEMMLEGAKLSFERAEALGIVNKLWESESHDAFVRKVVDYAREFCPPNRAARAVGGIKRALQSGLEMGLEQGLALERELLAQLSGSEDAREGLGAFAAKRKAFFRGR